MRKVLVPIDGSENAKRAADFAATLCSPSQPLTIHLLYVCRDVPYSDRSHAFHSNKELERPERERGEALLKSEAARIAASGAHVVPELVMGQPARAIVARSDALGCDSITMGMKGYSLLTELLLGSTTMTVLHNTKLPVTLVK
jgi:nucleotide-binding universal stress UspA family protein